MNVTLRGTEKTELGYHKLESDCLRQNSSSTSYQLLLLNLLSSCFPSYKNPCLGSVLVNKPNGTIIIDFFKKQISLTKIGPPLVYHSPLNGKEKL